MDDDDLLVPLSALEHWSFCRRQCGLIHLENLWADSARTVEGSQLHEKVDLPGLEQRPGIRIARALDLRSDCHRLVGRADVVVFHDDVDPNEGDRPLTALALGPPRASHVAPEQSPGTTSSSRAIGRPFPVEYKRGARTNFRHAELQLCGQALCLEEMLGVAVPNGAIYYGASRRRREVAFSEALRADTARAAREILAMLESGRTPEPEPGAKCAECSLRDHCLPDLPAPGRVRAYLEGLT